MTMWHPDLEERAQPRYVAIADAIARDIQKEVLQPGQRLPTHRELARHLGVTVGTVTRAYAEANRRGLTVGEVGRGTFVQGPKGMDALPLPSETGIQTDGDALELGLALPWTSPEGMDAGELAATLRRVADTGCTDDLLEYQPNSASGRHRAALASWLTGLGVGTHPDRVLATSGSQLGCWGRKDAQLADDFEFIYDIFPILKERAGQESETLSGGEQQMLAMARAM